jgi:hypothetical protein
VRQVKVWGVAEITKSVMPGLEPSISQRQAARFQTPYVDWVRLNKRRKSPMGLPVTHYLTGDFASFRSPDFSPLRRPDFWEWPRQIESIHPPICPN